MKIFLATWLLEQSQGIALNKGGCDSRLISYFHTKDCTERVLPYSKNGVIDDNISSGNRSGKRRERKDSSDS